MRGIGPDGRTIPRNGYRLEGFLDDGVGSGAVDAPRGGFCTTTVQRERERVERRETAPLYRLRQSWSNGEARMAAAGG